MGARNVIATLSNIENPASTRPSVSGFAANVTSASRDGTAGAPNALKEVADGGISTRVK